uniref:Glycoside hydrolase family 2 catalytic domain-containing protein n=1 Tax=Panagrolaimus sp. ES5 TaxID=591445 RepID=A0AC34G1A8_9BILA
MLEWMNGNCYRTSHYPYSEERAYEADRRGIVVIAETPAVGLLYFTKNILKLHQQMLLDLFKRDHRHPSIVMWSLANEPATSKGDSREYFNEYGADTIEGFSTEPSVSFSVQYQVELLAKTHEAIDFLRESGDLTGEMIWNFADFMTDQTLTRVIGNHKGVLTRNRQPKMAAYLLKKRYAQLSSTSSSTSYSAATQP